MHGEKKWRADVSAGSCFVLEFGVGAERSVEVFHSLDDLALRAVKLARGGNAMWSARGRDGSPLSQARVVARGARRVKELCDPWGYHGRWWLGAYPGYERRSDAVKGTACRRGGGGGCRRFASIGTKRLAQVLPGAEEPAPRPAQSVKNLPDSWNDERMRIGQKSWKKQRRGSKAWDRGHQGALGKDRWALCELLGASAREDGEGDAASSMGE